MDEARAKRYHGLTPVSNYLEDYHILQTSKEEPLVRAIRNHMCASTTAPTITLPACPRPGDAEAMSHALNEVKIPERLKVNYMSIDDAYRVATSK